MSQFGPNIKPQIVVKDEITVFIRKKKYYQNMFIRTFLFSYSSTGLKMKL